MNKSESKYMNTARRMDEAFIKLLEKKDFDYITIKDICNLAGVNRSTFYLHYENIGDLVNEVSAYINQKFLSVFGSQLTQIIQNIESCDLRELLFIKNDVLIPYLEFLRENRSLLMICIKHPALIGSEATFKFLDENIIRPILKRFHYKKENQKFIISFYINGFKGIITEWIKGDFKESVEQIAEIVKKCIIPDGNGIFFPEKLNEFVSDE